MSKERFYHYTESGLRNIWLANGFEHWDTPHGRGTSITDVEGLHRSIGSMLARKPNLTGAEIRFLRKELELSQRTLGELVGLSDQSVALYEKRGRMPQAAVRILQLAYREFVNGNTPVKKLIEELNDMDRHAEEKCIAALERDHWRLRAA